MNQSMASTQQDSLNISGSMIPANNTTQAQSASKLNEKKDDAVAIYEMQRNYYFGEPAADADSTAKTKPLKQFAEASEPLDSVQELPSS